MRVRIEHGVDARDVGLQRLLAVAREVVGQEVIEEDVGDDARVVAVVGDEDAAEGGHVGWLSVNASILRCLRIPSEIASLPRIGPLTKSPARLPIIDSASSPPRKRCAR